ncbi:MAG: hypothetical protein K5873_08090 [Treponema sp.]|nr:hypothetical protein [Treponema sp.]
MESVILKIYRERYSISHQDLADAGESNRITLLITSIILFLFGSGNFIAILLLHHSDLSNHFVYLLYFGLFAFSSIFLFSYSKLVKNVPQEKSYIIKTIPVYIIIYMSFFLSVYNFYFLGHPFNGFVTYCLTGFISLYLFSFSPMIFLLGLVLTIGVMAPGIYSNFSLSGLADSILTTVLIFCLTLFKKGIEKKNILLLKKQTRDLEAKTFGNFTLLYKNKIVKFSRTKSNELIAYLVYKNGSSVNTKELISILWGDQANSSRHGSSLRNLIVDIKHTLNSLEILNFFITEYNNFRINPAAIKCDYYDFLNGDKNAVKNFVGEFMNQFSWAEETAAFLEMKAIKKS